MPASGATRDFYIWNGEGKPSLNGNGVGKGRENNFGAFVGEDASYEGGVQEREQIMY